MGKARDSHKAFIAQAGTYGSSCPGRGDGKWLNPGCALKRGPTACAGQDRGGKRKKCLWWWMWAASKMKLPLAEGQGTGGATWRPQ